MQFKKTDPITFTQVIVWTSEKMFVSRPFIAPYSYLVQVIVSQNSILAFLCGTVACSQDIVLTSRKYLYLASV